MYVFYLERQDNIDYESDPSERLTYSKMVRIPTIKLRNYALLILLNAVLELIFLLKITKKKKIDVIVAEGLGPSNIAMLVSRLLKRRFIFDLSDDYPSFISCYIQNGFLKKIFESLATIITNLSVKLSDATVVVSDGLINKKYTSKVYKIVNGVTEDYFINSKQGQETVNEVITFIGGVEPWVNFAPPLEAIKSLNAESSSHCLLKIVGDGSKLTDLKNLVSKKNLNDSVLFTGWVPYSKLHEQMSQSDMFILPFDASSISSLAMPMKIHEYAIAKKPIISTPLPEIKKIYGSSVLYAVTKEDYQKAIKSLITDKGLKLHLVNEAYHIASNYSWKRLAGNYEQLLTHSKED